MDKEFTEVVKEYFERFPEATNESPTSVTFSILLGLPIQECTYMSPEPEWSDEQLDEFDGVMEEVMAIQRGKSDRKTGQKKCL